MVARQRFCWPPATGKHVLSLPGSLAMPKELNKRHRRLVAVRPPAVASSVRQCGGEVSQTHRTQGLRGRVASSAGRSSFFRGAMFATGTDGLVAVGILPLIATDYGIDTRTAAEILTAYMVAFAVSPFAPARKPSLLLGEVFTIIFPDGSKAAPTRLRPSVKVRVGPCWRANWSGPTADKEVEQRFSGGYASDAPGNDGRCRFHLPNIQSLHREFDHHI